MTTEQLLLAGLATLFGGGALGAIVVKLLGRQVDNADVQLKRASAQKDDVDSLRAIISEVKEQRAEEKAAATVRIDALEARLTKLEERERHMLTRAAVHEAWDVLAFSMLRSMNPEHPAPPPLTSDEIEGFTYG